MKTLEFSIPAVPQSLNVWSRSHWSKRNAMVREWHGLVAMFRPSPKCFRVAENAPPANVTLSFVSRKDGDNLCKAVLDSLVYNGLLLDDGTSGVAGLTIKARRANKGEHEETHVKIEYPEPGGVGIAVPGSKGTRLTHQPRVKGGSRSRSRVTAR